MKHSFTFLGTGKTILEDEPDAAPAVMLTPATKVKLHSLRTHPHLNGRSAIVLSAAGRDADDKLTYNIRLDGRDRQEVKAKAINLREITESEGTTSKKGAGPFLYYWDERDGDHYQGWWIGSAVGSNHYMAYASGDAESPELCRGWRGANQLLDLRVALVNDVVLVRAGGLELEGAYVRESSCPHDHGGRSVYRRERGLHANEAPVSSAPPRPPPPPLLARPLH
eukprot:1741687-Prymnesium_polylepis.1